MFRINIFRRFVNRVARHGGPVIVEGPADISPLLQRLVDGTMPPEDEPRLSLDEIQVIRLWLDAGAPMNSYAAADPSVTAPLVTDEDREYYAFRQLVRPGLPRVEQHERARTAIDHFVLARLEEQHLGYSVDADRQTLLRRACFDLLGLPPSSEDVDQFVTSSSPPCCTSWGLITVGWSTNTRDGMKVRPTMLSPEPTCIHRSLKRLYGFNLSPRSLLSTSFNGTHRPGRVCGEFHRF